MARHQGIGTPDRISALVYKAAGAAFWLDHAPRPPPVVREKDVLDFVGVHPQEINLGKVDQVWFLDLVLLKGMEPHEPDVLCLGERKGHISHEVGGFSGRDG